MTVLAAPDLTVGQAKQLAATMYEHGWRICEIRAYLERRGVSRARETIRRWAIPEVAERNRLQNEERMRRKYAAARNGRIGRDDHSEVFKLTRLLALVEQAGLSHAAAARVIRLDFGDAFTEHQIRHAVETRRYPAGRKGPRKAAA